MSTPIIPNYRIIRSLGQGAVGQVFEALAEHLSCRVAIKVLRPEVSQEEEAVARLFNEARAANIIGHPSIVRALDYGRTSDGTAYLVLEYLEGESLRAQIQAGGVHDKAVRIARQVASAMAVAHARGVIHRDLKPDNLFLVHDPEVPGGERVKVLDFGLAKLAPALRRESDARYATQSGALLGTPAYMAPEQCRGDSEIEGAADVYSLGAVLYHMRAGEPPFTSEALGALLAQHIYEPVPALSKRDPLIPPALADLVMSMLRKEPKQRPSMGEVAARLEALNSVVRPAQSGPLNPGSLSGAQYVERVLPPLALRWLWPVAIIACMGMAALLGASIKRGPAATPPLPTSPPSPALARPAPAPADPPTPAPAPAPVVPSSGPVQVDSPAGPSPRVENPPPNLGAADLGPVVQPGVRDPAPSAQTDQTVPAQLADPQPPPPGDGMRSPKLHQLPRRPRKEPTHDQTAAPLVSSGKPLAPSGKPPVPNQPAAKKPVEYED